MGGMLFEQAFNLRQSLSGLSRVDVQQKLLELLVERFHVGFSESVQISLNVEIRHLNGRQL